MDDLFVPVGKTPARLLIKTQSDLNFVDFYTAQNEIIKLYTL